MKEAPILIIIENTNGLYPYSEIDADNRVTEICDTLSIGASVQNILLTAKTPFYFGKMKRKLFIVPKILNKGECFLIFA